MASATKMLFRRRSVTNGRFWAAKNSASLKKVAMTPRSFSTSQPSRSEHHLRLGPPNRSPSPPRQNLPDLSGRHRRVHLAVDLLEQSHRARTRLRRFSGRRSVEVHRRRTRNSSRRRRRLKPEIAKTKFSEKIESCHVRTQIKLKIVMCLKNFFGI